MPIDCVWKLGPESTTDVDGRCQDIVRPTARRGDRAGIWTRLQMLDSLVPSIFTFFKDVHYLEAVAGCMTRSTRLLPRDTVSTALAGAFSDTTERTDRAVLPNCRVQLYVLPGAVGRSSGLGSSTATCLRHAPLLSNAQKSQTLQAPAHRSVSKPSSNCKIVAKKSILGSCSNTCPRKSQQKQL